MKKSSSPRVAEKYQSIKKKCQAECRKDKAAFINTISEERDTKLFWQYIKSKRKDTTTCTVLKDNSGTPQANAKSKVSILLNHFSSVFSTPSDVQIDMKTPPAPSIEPFTISDEGACKLMKNLSPFKSTGPDGIPPFILKELATELSPVFSILFQACIDQGKIPLDWKMAHITPIFKKGDPSKASNYRPVSLTSVPCKLLEHIVHSQVINHLLANNILCDNQHGFRKQILRKSDDFFSSWPYKKPRQ